MSDSPRVAVYLDFDNVVISRYDSIFGRGKWRSDNAMTHAKAVNATDPVDQRLEQAQVNIGAIIDYATSFGTVAFTKAYADWSVPANAAYRQQLVDRAVDLTQMFSTSGTKNGADIRLSIDAVDDLFRHDDLTHVVIAAGDSDYISLAQHCKRLGRYVVGIGVAGATSTALVAACDEFTDYADLPGVTPPVTEKPAKSSSQRRSGPKSTKEPADEATTLLTRAIQIGLEKSDDEWLYSSSIKTQMQRLNSSFKEKSLGFPSFKAFVESRSDTVDTRTLANGQLQVRLKG